jgi:hypothetical protein
MHQREEIIIIIYGITVCLEKPCPVWPQEFEWALDKLAQFPINTCLQLLVMAFSPPQKMGCKDLLEKLSSPCRTEKNVLQCMTLHINKIFKCAPDDENAIDNYSMIAQIGYVTSILY